MKVLRKLEQGAIVQMEGEENPIIVWVSDEQLNIINSMELLMLKGRKLYKHVIAIAPRWAGKEQLYSAVNKYVR